jgi:hypothetical protein
MATRIQTVCVFVKQWLQETYDGFEGDWDPSLLTSYVQEFHQYHSAMKRSEFINISRELQKYFNWAALYEDMEANSELHCFNYCVSTNTVSENQFNWTSYGFPSDDTTWVLEEHFIDNIRSDIEVFSPDSTNIGKIVWKNVPKDEIRRMKEDCSDSCDCITVEEIVIASTPSCGDCGAPTEITVAGDTDCLNTICPAGVMAV